MLTRDELTIWIETLRSRLERGELANLPPVHLQPWLTLPDVEAWVRIRLASVDGWRARPPEERRGAAALDSQRQVAEELSLLYERLVERKPYAPIDYRTQP